MGRETSRRAPGFEQILSHAAWVYEETAWMAINDPECFEKAFRAAIDAAINKAHQGFTIGVLDDILEKAEDLDADPDNDLNEDGVASLIWYAKLLDETLPEELRLENDGNNV
jgi:hypothetical protein